MGFPDRIERTMDVAQSPDTVWAALTTAEGLGTWFGHQASIDLRTGGAAQVTWDDGQTIDLRVERVEEPTAFAFTWPIDDPAEGGKVRCTYVEFTLEPVGAGTRLRVVETGFAQLPDDDYRATYDSHTEGWTNELGELNDYLDAA